MKLRWFVPALAVVSLYSQAKPFVGRWDFTVTTDAGVHPQWMEVVEKDGGLQARIQPRGGAVRPASAVKVEGGHLLIVVSPAAADRPEVRWDLTASSGKLSGVQKNGEAVSARLAAVRAPELKRPMPAAWTSPEPLFNGRELTGWTPFPAAVQSQWVARNGELTNEGRGANLRTIRTFDDFKLHIEVNCPEICNSGIYLRGRYEIQVGAENNALPDRQMGAVYGYFPAAGNLPMGAGTWEVFDITLVGRTVTVVRNGVTIHDRVELPGITGGALDSNEGEPGPFYLQGDHSGVLRYRNVTVALPRK